MQVLVHHCHHATLALAAFVCLLASCDHTAPARTPPRDYQEAATATDTEADAGGSSWGSASEHDPSTTGGPGDPAPACHDLCPRSAKCTWGAGDKFCTSLAQVISGVDVGDQADELLGACMSEQPHCDLCYHLHAACVVAGTPQATCLVAQAECNCLAEQAGAP